VNRNPDGTPLTNEQLVAICDETAVHAWSAHARHPKQGEPMTQYEATIHLSNDFQRTCIFFGDDNAEKAALDGCYDGCGFTLRIDGAVDASDVLERVWEIANSYPGELHCAGRYGEAVDAYRYQGNRSLSTGDMVVIRNLNAPSAEDGRYVVASLGFKRVGAGEQPFLRRPVGLRQAVAHVERFGFGDDVDSDALILDAARGLLRADEA